MKLLAHVLIASALAGHLAVADEAATETPPTPPPAPAQEVGLADNLFLNAGAGVERPVGEDSTPFGLFGVNWGLPLTQPDHIAWGLQLGSNVKFREDDPELNGTFGGFARNFETLEGRQGAFALLFDYRRTAFHNDLWDVRPILGTTVSDQDALGIEGVAGLGRDGGQEIIDQFSTFWTRDWNETVGTELGVGYQFSHVDEALLRGRVAFALTEYVDLGFGGDVNTDGDYAVGVNLSYHFGGTGRHPSLHNIGGSGAGAYTPFPDASFPTLAYRNRR